MLSIILVDEGSEPRERERALADIPSNAGCELMLVGASPAPRSMSHSRFFATTDGDYAQALRTALSTAQGDFVLLLSTSVRLRAGEFAAISHLASERTNDYALFFALHVVGREICEAPIPTIDNLISGIVESSTSAPLLMVIRRTMALDLSIMGPISSAPIAHYAAATIGSGGRMYLAPEEIRAESAGSGELMPEQARAVLQRIVERCNVEDLFPLHDWKNHSAESAALAYQQLAAMFLRYSDVASAMECLRHSDTFEDSPRSLAMKGLIAMKNGETLGAVANMVSSLKQYEIRKKENVQHYVTFSPRDLDLINKNLSAGLTALNRRENALALEHFASAVFKFDPFYEECGLENLRAISH